MRTGYRRHRWFYSFRAWVDERGSNEDRRHVLHCEALGRFCPHRRLWDLNWNKDSGNIVRVVRRRRPFAFAVYVGRRMHGFQVGMPR